MTHSIGGLLFVYVVMTVVVYYQSCRANEQVPEYAVPRPASLMLAILWPITVPWGILLRHLFKWGIVKPASRTVEWLAVGYVVFIAVLVSLIV